MNVQTYVVPVLGGLLIALGVAQAAAFTAGNDTLVRAVRATAASPLPLPFRDTDGYEHFSARKDIALVMQDGQRISIDTHEAFSRMDGPHKRKIVYVAAVEQMPLFRTETLEPILKRLMCTDAVLSDLGVDVTERAGVEFIYTQQARGRGDWYMRRYLVCQ